MNRKDYRKFVRHMRATDMYKYLKSGCDMGWYGHFVSPVKINKEKLIQVAKKIKKDYSNLIKEKENE